MRKSKLFWPATLLTILVIAAATVHGADDRPTAGEANRYKGKIVVVNLDNASNMQSGSSEFLKDAIIEKIGDRYFISGTVELTPDEADDQTNAWRKGTQASIAWSKVE